MKNNTRRKTRVVPLGNLKIGGGNPVRIKGMLKSSARRPTDLVREAKKLAQEGAEAIRIAVKKKEDVRFAALLKKNKVNVPLIADIHFNYRFALEAIYGGFDGIRLNPLNIPDAHQVRQVAKEAKKAGISIRVGVNSGGFRRDFASDAALARAMNNAVARYLRILEKSGFFDTILSLKASSVSATVAANQECARRFSYPLHLGVTATGPFLEGVVKSTLGVGILLASGIGDVIRISLTGPSFWEIRVAQFILQFLGKRSFFPEILSCPTCSRCEVNLIKIVDSFRTHLAGLKGISLPEKIALMGCIVNGPGEARQADIGVAFGGKKAALFKKDTILETVASDKVTRRLLKKIKDGTWT